MENFKKTKLVTGVIESMAMFFLLLVFLFMCGEKYSYGIGFRNYEHCFYSFFPVLLISWGLSKKFEPQINFLLNAIYAFIVSFTLYVISNSGANIEHTMFIVLLFVMIIAWLSILYCKRGQNQQEKPNTKQRITESQQTEIKNEIKVELTQEQKRAVICLLAFVQGSSSSSAYDVEAYKIAQTVISPLGLSKNDVEQILMDSMEQDSEKEIDVIINSLKEIDKGYLKKLYSDCHRIAFISGREDMIKIVETIFEKELNIIEDDTLSNISIGIIVLVSLIIIACLLLK